MKKTMQRRRPIRITGNVWGTDRFAMHQARAKMIRDGQDMGEYSWKWIYAAEWRAGMQRPMKRVNRT